MVSAIVKWRLMPGVVLTSPSQVLSVDLEAFTDTKPMILGGEGGIHYVEFTVKNSVGATISVIKKSALAWRFPNFSSVPSPMPGALSGMMAGALLYGITLEANTLPYGKITVSARVFSHKGTITTVSDVWFWNNSDGTPRLGSSKVIYVNSTTGNDLNSGTIGSPVRTPLQAMKLVVNNPAGSTLADRHAGGGEIICTGNFVGFGPFTSVDWHTGGDQWLTITATPGTTFTRAGSGNFVPCYGIANSGAMWIHWVGWTLLGQGPQFHLGNYPSTTATMRNWWDGLTMTPILWNEDRPWDVRYAPLGGADEPTVTDGPNPERINTFITCSQFKGRGASYECHYHHDVVVGPYIAIAFMSNARESYNASIFNVLVERQRYVSPDVHGLWHSRGSNLVVSVPVVGQMRVDQVGPVIMLANQSGYFLNLPGDPTISLDTQLAEMPGYTDWVYQFEGCANAGNNGKFACIAVGNDGGVPYAIFSNPSAVAETLSSTVRIQTARPGGGQTWYGAVHPDLHQMNTDCTELVVSHFAARDLDNTQGHFGGGHTHIRCVIANVTDGGGTEFRNNFAGCSLLDCVFVHNALNSEFALGSTTLTGSCFEENVFRTIGGSPVIGSSYWRGNHFVSGATYTS